MKRILLLSNYFEPDLSAGSFRMKALVDAFMRHTDVSLHVVTTVPNRYASFKKEVPLHEQKERVEIDRVQLPSHKSGMVDQAKAYTVFYRHAMKVTNKQQYDLVFATSSRLFTAFLGARIANKKNLPLYLDIRDIFVDTMKDVLNPMIALPILPVLKGIESYTFGRAQRINIVSNGFRPYFEKRVDASKLQVFSNGIDQLFLDRFSNSLLSSSHEGTTSPQKKPLTILYAGNFGEGQGLHHIVPALAEALPQDITFKIYGDGGRKQALMEATETLSNVSILPPVSRTELLEAYAAADILFLHLNDYDAFKKVLPSKIFEYAATGKPIWAGVGGYAAQFLKEEVQNAAVFPPKDVTSALDVFQQLEKKTIDRKSFNQKFSRTSIMGEFVKSILNTMHND